jgi:hypothetical protein
MSLPAWATDARAVVNGLIGDLLAEQGSSLAVPLAFRTAAGGELPLDRAGLREVLPDAGPRLCVLVHGLMSSESVWRFGGPERLTYGELLARDRGVVPVYVRYNTGRHISTNGRELAAGLQRLVRAWPVQGGRALWHMERLVVGAPATTAGTTPPCRTACGAGAWARKVRRVMLPACRTAPTWRSSPT